MGDEGKLWGMKGSFGDEGKLWGMKESFVVEGKLWGMKESFGGKWTSRGPISPMFVLQAVR